MKHVSEIDAPVDDGFDRKASTFFLFFRCLCVEFATDATYFAASS